MKKDLIKKLLEAGISDEMAALVERYIDLYKGDLDAFLDEVRKYSEIEELAVGNDAVISGDFGESQRRVDHDYDGDSLEFYGYARRDDKSGHRW